MRGGGDHAQRRGQRGVVLRRQQGRHEDHIGDARAERVERPLGRIGEHELGADLMADDGGQPCRLFTIRFDGENDRH